MQTSQMGAPKWEPAKTATPCVLGPCLVLSKQHRGKPQAGSTCEDLSVKEQESAEQDVLQVCSACWPHTCLDKLSF